MVDIVRILRRSIAQGIAGTQYDDRVLGHQCGGFHDAMEAGRLLDGGALNRIVLYVTALMEVKSSMGVIVAAPTAGACAALPGAVIAMAEAHGPLRGGHGARDARRRPDRRVLRHPLDLRRGGRRLPGGGRLRGVHGGGRTGRRSPAARRDQALAAASMALQSMLGLICDPVANRVEVPCLGKNVMAAATRSPARTWRSPASIRSFRSTR